MATRTLQVTIQNTGSFSWTFVVGASISTNVAGTGCDLNVGGGQYTDLPLQTITLAPGQSGTVQWTFDDAKVGGTTVMPGQTLYAIVKVWQSQSGGIPQNCLAGAYKSFTAVGTPPSVQITQITVV